MKKWLTLSGAIASEVAATLALKAALQHPGWYVLAAVGYVAAFVFLTLCLRLGMSIGIAYGIWGAGGVTVTALLSALLFAEPLTLVMGAGIVLIIGGVLTVELGSHRAQDQAQNRDPDEVAA